MCKVYNSIGCLTTAKSHLSRHNINDFNSINDILNFLHKFQKLRQEIISRHEQLIENEKNILETEILNLYTRIKKDKARFKDIFLSEIEEVRQQLNNISSLKHFNFIQRFCTYIKQWILRKKLQTLEINLDYNINNSVRDLLDQLQHKIERKNYITSHFRDAVSESCFSEINVIDNKKRIIEEVKNSIYGALGEHKVVKELENLSDDNILINDFSISFNPALYNRQEDYYVKSVQIDHLLITPSGIFLIETKNWSEKSLANLDLRSPVEQIRRTNFALFKILSGDFSKNRLQLNHHHWGAKKIPVKNLIVLTNTKPNEEFQYVKVLTVNELIGYIKYFKPVLTNGETQRIASYLLGLNG